MTSLGSTFSRLHVAVEGLATGTAMVKQRLRIVYYDHLQVLTPQDFPLECQDRFRWIINELTKTTKGNKYPLTEKCDRVSLRMYYMKQKTAKKIAVAVFKLYESVCSALASESYHRPRRKGRVTVLNGDTVKIEKVRIKMAELMADPDKLMRVVELAEKLSMEKKRVGV